ncbi:metallophosphoesterase [Aestuariivivens sediminicola]|uniref:metallophosphoesterase n=1 Tax=Aestuariivivens sediminicola TaxID=2913560 RepID=UPI001F585134|nr:metallophosphoesterase [Aestuariivivens sediminicola]
MRYSFLCLVLLFLACKLGEKKSSGYFDVGIIADCQYCDCDASGIRYYRTASGRLQEAVNVFNSKELKYVVHLGDFIDREFSSYNAVVPIWNTLKANKRHVLGNHDFSVADTLKPLVLSKLGLTHRYYSFKVNSWRFIVLDGNDLSAHGAISAEKKKETDSLFKVLQKDSLPNLKPWNGGLSRDQLAWVKGELDDALRNDERVGFYCHFPVARPLEMHNLWNDSQFLNLIEGYSNVKFYFNGHNHNGDYTEKNGVHFLTFKGMVDTPDTSAFSIARITEDSILIKGYGRENSRRLKIKE